MEQQKTLNTKIILRKKTKAEVISLSDFKLSYITVVFKRVCDWQKTDIQIKGTETNARTYSYPVFDKDTKNTQ